MGPNEKIASAYTGYSFRQAAAVLHVPVSMVRAMIARGALVSLTPGFVTTDSVERQRLGR